MRVQGSAIRDVMDAIGVEARKRAKQSESHERLFEAYKHGGIEGLLRRCESAMLEHALNAADLIREELGREIMKEDWELIQALPLVMYTMEKIIRSEEGYSCCVDKTYHRLAKSIIGGYGPQPTPAPEADHE